MNFTKDYIELCKSDKIQKLKYWKDTDGVIDWLLLKTGDWLYLPLREEIWCIDEIKNFGIANVWLPTGDQLDEIIVKICKEGNHYTTGTSSSNKWFVEVSSKYHKGENQIIFYDINPLIAKLKLLLQLLEVKDTK
uniref:Uncharacterized protein n=1 Tax=viral metagenome TaxID=1070528 RepID=A0A6H1ZDD4_9ZZZZ